MVISVVDCKLIFCDLSDLKLHKSNKVTSACQKLIKEDKVIVFFLKGALTNDLKKFLKKSCNYIICGNGAEIYDCKNDEVIYEKIIDNEIILKIVRYCQDLKIDMLLCNDTEKYEVDELSDEELLKKHFNSLELFSDNYDRMLVIKNVFKEKFSQVAVVNEDLVYGDKKNGRYNRLVVSRDATKRKGLIALLDYLGLVENKVLLVGKKFDYNILNEYKIRILENDEDLGLTLEKIQGSGY